MLAAHHSLPFSLITKDKFPIPSSMSNHHMLDGITTPLLTTVVVILPGPGQWGKPVLLTTVIGKKLASLTSGPVRANTPSPMRECSDCHSFRKRLPLSIGFAMAALKMYYSDPAIRRHQG